MTDLKNRNKLRDFYILWSTQSFSQLGSSITAFALTLWLYEKTGSSLSTALLTILSYLPYVTISIFAGALIDRLQKKKTMLVCDTIAALCTLLVFILYKTNSLALWHLYAINLFSGFMNTIQQPASEVTMTLIIPKDSYQKTSGLQSLSRSLISILSPLIATALYGLSGLDLVIGVDLLSFLIAFIALAFFIRIPEAIESAGENVIDMAREGFAFLKKTPLILTIILFMSGVNLVASAFDAALPGYVIPNPRGGSYVLGIVTSMSGIAMVIGSILVSIMPKPKDRVRVIYMTMLISLGSENLIMPLSRQPIVWCLSQIIGWFLVPIMSSNENIIIRNVVPVELQGRIYACRNTIQFFTIPIGLFLGGFLVDEVCEPFMAAHSDSQLLTTLFGTGKGSGAGLVIFLLGIAGIAMCLISGSFLKKYHYSED